MKIAKNILAFAAAAAMALIVCIALTAAFGGTDTVSAAEAQTEVAAVSETAEDEGIALLSGETGEDGG